MCVPPFFWGQEPAPVVELAVDLDPRAEWSADDGRHTATVALQLLQRWNQFLVRLN